MNARCVVNKLLEATDDFNPEQAKDYAMGSQEYLIQKQPPEVAAILQHAPPDFVNAFFAKEKADWEIGWMENDNWPQYDDDANTWRSVSYYSDYTTEDGKLYQNVMENESGDVNHIDGAEVGTPQWRRMLEPFAYYEWEENNVRYAQWVLDNGEDPLGYFMVHRTNRIERAWIIGFVQAEDRARFWKARETGVPGGSVPIENPDELPPEVKEYVNLDANLLNQDASWAEIVGMAQQGGEDAPQMKQARDGTRYVQFKVKLNAEQENAAYAEELARVAAESVKRHTRDAKKARRSHKKNPHYMV